MKKLLLRIIDAENTFDQRTTKNPTQTKKAQIVINDFHKKYDSVPFDTVTTNDNSI